MVLRDGRRPTLIDSGYPGDVPAVEASLREPRGPARGRPGRAPHARARRPHGRGDHFHERYGTPPYTDPIEVRHARREHLEQAGPWTSRRTSGGRARCPGRCGSCGGRGPEGVGAARSAVPASRPARPAGPAGAGRDARAHVRAHRVPPARRRSRDHRRRVDHRARGSRAPSGPQLIGGDVQPPALRPGRRPGPARRTRRRRRAARARAGAPRSDRRRGRHRAGPRRRPVRRPATRPRSGSTWPSRDNVSH